MNDLMPCRRFGLLPLQSWSMRVPGAKDVLDKRYVERVGSICSDGRVGGHAQTP